MKNKPLKFQTPNNDSKSLPKSMVKGKLKDEHCDDIEFMKIFDLFSSLTEKEAKMAESFLTEELYKRLTENKYVINEEVDEIYMEIADFFIKHDAVEIINRTPCGDDAIQVRFEIEKPFIITDSDFDMLEKIAFVYGDEFRIFVNDGKFIITLTIHGYYNKQKIVED